MDDTPIVGKMDGKIPICGNANLTNYQITSKLSIGRDTNFTFSKNDEIMVNFVYFVYFPLLTNQTRFYQPTVISTKNAIT
jgi:hypothetical protein